jgi:outer membrane receptor protein involved in Fe transport
MNMKPYLLLLPATLLLPLHNASAQSAPPDTAVVALSEVFITADKVETRHATSLQTVGAKQIERDGITSPAALSVLVPNFFMPSYGSKLTSAIYIRGVGSRMNESAVALYVDGAPYMDKSAFDFDFLDIVKVEALRGPQGALYGRNAMGGIINVYTASPFVKEGATVTASYGNANTIKASARYAHRWGNALGVSASAGYHKADGFFTNVYDGSPADAIETVNARLRLDGTASDRLRLSYALSGEHSRQRGYAYGAVDSLTGKVRDVNHNDPAGYERLMAVNSLSLRYEGEGYSVSSVTSSQLFDDRLQLDLDYSPADLFTLEQRQKQHAVTEEVIIKSRDAARNVSATGSRYQWLFGAFGFYKSLSTAAPVDFHADGVGMIQGAIDGATAGNPRAPQITIVDAADSSRRASSLHIPSDFEQPSLGLAAYHQSAFRDLLTRGLQLTLALRLDYEQVQLRYASQAAMHTKVKLPAPTAPAMLVVRAVDYTGNLRSEFFEALPQATVQYAWGHSRYRVYATAAKGYTAGGYNTNLFADLVQSKLQASNGRADGADTVKQQVGYKPEYSWSYELGGHAGFLNDRLQAAAVLFYVDTRDLQIAQFVPSGYGRVMKNAGRSASYGAELQLSGRVGDFTANLAYGYTHATFTRYVDSTAAAAEVSYEGKFVPFAPRHTLSLGGEYTFAVETLHATSLRLSLLYTGAGKIYFTEANEDKASQGFYSLLSGKITLQKGALRLGIWAKNLLGAGYKTFYFEARGNGFAQQGRPAQVGVEATVAF